jgi:hypothetical protein
MGGGGGGACFFEAHRAVPCVDKHLHCHKSKRFLARVWAWPTSRFMVARLLSAALLGAASSAFAPARAAATFGGRLAAPSPPAARAHCKHLRIERRELAGARAAAAHGRRRTMQACRVARGSLFVRPQSGESARGHSVSSTATSECQPATVCFACCARQPRCAVRAVQGSHGVLCVLCKEAMVCYACSAHAHLMQGTSRAPGPGPQVEAEAAGGACWAGLCC